MTAPAKPHESPARDARSQLLFRQLNEQLRTLAGGGELDVVCECVNGSCFDRVLVPLDAYEAVRRFPTRFVVKEGRVAGEVERVVESRGGYAVVEKSGADAEHAILLDPRRNASRRLHAVQAEDQAQAREVFA